MDCKGTLTLRQGFWNTVEGNYFFGNGISETGGIRITGRGHRIINNYFQDLQGVEVRSALTLFCGSPAEDYNPDDGGHVAVESTTIAFNTMVNCAQGFSIGQYDEDDANPIAPHSNTFANNIFTSDGSGLAVWQNPDYTGENETWEGNIINTTNEGDVPSSGTTSADPLLSLSDGVYRIVSGSPAVDAAAGSYPEVTLDMEGQTRTAPKDVGADELGSGPIGPLTPQNVGPTYYPEYTTSIQNHRHQIHTVSLSSGSNGPAVFKSFANRYRIPAQYAGQVHSAAIYDIRGKKIGQYPVSRNGVIQTGENPRQSRTVNFIKLNQN